MGQEDTSPPSSSVQQIRVPKRNGHGQRLNVCKGAGRLLSEGKKSSIVEIPEKYGEIFLKGAGSLEDDPFALSQECQAN